MHENGWLGSNAWRRFAGAGLLLAFLPLATVGCFGRFQLVRNVYHFNQQVSPDKWMRWFVFLVLNVIPIYGLAAWIDALITNSIEFWTGENPVQPHAAGATRVVQGPDGSQATLTLQADGAIAVAIRGTDGFERRFRLVREANAVAAHAEDGTLLARVGDVDGRPALLAGALAPAR